MASYMKAIEALVEYMNVELGFGGVKLWNQVDCHNVATVGMLYLYRCLGVWAIHAMANEAGGVDVLLSASTARELESMLRAFRAGLHYRD